MSFRPGYNTLNVLTQPDASGNNPLYLNGDWYIGDVKVNATAEQLNNLGSNLTVANKTGGTLTKGTLVYISGYNTSLDAPTVAKADADSANTQATHVVSADILNDVTGVVVGSTTITGIDTSSYSAVGSFVYESTTAGESTPTAPTAVDDDRRVVGVVKVKDASVGSIYYFPALGGLELAAPYLNNQTPGTVVASGAVIVDSNKDIADFRNLSGTNLKAGKDAVAGSVTIFPTTTAKGKTVMTSADNSGNTQTTINVAAQAGAVTYTVPDAAASGAFAILATAQSAVIGSTQAEIDLQCDVSAQTETIAAAGAISVVKRISKLALVGAGAVTLAAPDASMFGMVKHISMTADNGDVTLALTNVQGQSSGTTATFNDVGDTLVLVGGLTKWTVTGEAGISLS